MPITYTARVADPAKEKTFFNIGTKTVELTDDLVEHCGLREPLLRLAKVLADKTKMTEITVLSVDFKGARIEEMTLREIEDAAYLERVRAYDEAHTEPAKEA